jgi:hypothetical protein
MDVDEFADAHSENITNIHHHTLRQHRHNEGPKASSEQFSYHHFIDPSSC